MAAPVRPVTGAGLEMRPRVGLAFCLSPADHQRPEHCMAGVYVHIPFCRQICSYCDYCTAPWRLLLSLWWPPSAGRSSCGPTRSGCRNRSNPFTSGRNPIHPPHRICGDDTRDHPWTVRRGGREEVAFEANPEDCTAEYLSALAEWASPGSSWECNPSTMPILRDWTGNSAPNTLLRRSSRPCRPDSEAWVWISCRLFLPASGILGGESRACGQPGRPPCLGLRVDH